jgi:ribosome-associated protein
LNTDNLISNIIEGIENVKGEEINILDLRTIENVACKYFIICSGNSSTQVNAITSSIKKCVSKELLEKPWHIEGLENSKWVLMDYVDVVIHIFNKETREFYNIEELWEDAKSTLVETKY